MQVEANHEIQIVNENGINDELDQNIRSSLWSTEIPIEFLFIENEIAQNLQESFYVVASKITYLPLLFSKNMKDLVKNSLSPTCNIDDFWFEYKNEPLKWQYPLGALFDLFGDSLSLPWQITIRFSQFPKDQLIKYTGEEGLKSCFMNNLKEANFLKHGDNARVNALTLQQQADYWESIKNANISAFWAIHTQFLPDIQSQKHVPIRICRPGLPFLQEPIEPLNKDGKEKTILEVIQQIYPKEIEQFKQKIKILIVHGIQIPLETPVTWLSNNLSFPDNFLYLCLKTK
eukprot:TRINITY_DN6370_c0_g1_i1.p1 TRINITY_DN6370_c0_g1~~TRINITY_DN6370_c0_g1_i1.p1  ORF type:complete len:288 (-),score=109.55 TRINITY_DN6370_c0_g1_i1:141-1004(-)